METISEKSGFTHWSTVDGSKTIPAEEIPHEHLSNIYYYTHFLYPDLYDNLTRRRVKQLLRDNYQGDILPYKPYYDWERGLLTQRGWIQPNGDIVHPQGKVLGNLNIIKTP
jgi:hypothetical protein